MFPPIPKQPHLLSRIEESPLEPRCPGRWPFSINTHNTQEKKKKKGQAEKEWENTWWGSHRCVHFPLLPPPILLFFFYTWLEAIQTWIPFSPSSHTRCALCVCMSNLVVAPSFLPPIIKPAQLLFFSANCQVFTDGEEISIFCVCVCPDVRRKKRGANDMWIVHLVLWG